MQFMRPILSSFKLQRLLYSELYSRVPINDYYVFATYTQIDNKSLFPEFVLSMVLCKSNITPLLKQRNYSFLASTDV